MFDTCISCIFSTTYDRDGNDLPDGEYVCVLSGKRVNWYENCDSYDTDAGDENWEDAQVLLDNGFGTCLPETSTEDDIWDFSGAGAPLPWGGGD